MSKIPFQSILSRLTGISTPWLGVSWQPPVNEKEVAQRVIVFLEDRRVLYTRLDLEVKGPVIWSIEEIRTKLTQELASGMDTSSQLVSSLRAMRAACRRFLMIAQHPTYSRVGQRDMIFWTALGELRATFGICIAQLALTYHIDVEDELASIFPESSNDDDLPPMLPENW